MCGREAIDCTHSGGLKHKISANRFSSRQRGQFWQKILMGIGRHKDTSILSPFPGANKGERFLRQKSFDQPIVGDHFFAFPLPNNLVSGLGRELQKKIGIGLCLTMTKFPN